MQISNENKINNNANLKAINISFDITIVYFSKHFLILIQYIYNEKHKQK